MPAEKPRARSLVAAFVIEMSGWRGGAPVLHPIAYADPREKDRSLIAPAWLVRAALEASSLEASRLELDLTEASVMTEGEDEQEIAAIAHDLCDVIRKADRG